MTSGMPGPRCVVIGGGISGLAAAWELLVRWPTASITVLEGSSEVGGKLRGGQICGVPIDLGAESVLARRPEATDLMRAVGLGEAMRHPNSVGADIFSRGELHSMPQRTLMGVPSDPHTLAGLLDDDAMSRVRAEGEHLGSDNSSEADISIGDLVAGRLGDEVVDRLIEPLLGGVYAGHARNISAAAAMPALLRAYQAGASLVQTAADALPGPSDPTAAKPPVFAGLVGGVHQLPLRLAQRLDAAGVQVLRGVTAREIRTLPHGQFEVATGAVPEPETLVADRVVVAVPPPSAARLLSECAPKASSELAQIEMASMAIVTMAFKAADLAPLCTSGFLVPPAEGLRIKAATYSSTKWQWLGDTAGGSGPQGQDLAILRVSLGRHREEAILQVSDESLVDVALADLATVRGHSVPEPLEAQVTRWGGGLPQYAVGHVDRIAAVRSAVAQVPGLSLCGAALDGVGIPACIASATRAVHELPDMPGRLEA